MHCWPIVAMIVARDYVVNEMNGKQANLVDWTGGQAKWAVHVSYQIFPKPPILCLHALLDGCENTGVSGTAWSLPFARVWTLYYALSLPKRKQFRRGFPLDPQPCTHIYPCM